MPELTRLVITGIRNISSAEFQPAKNLNFITGLNGSGKTSILEAIYLLSVARSFRTHLQRPIISDTDHQATVFAELDDKQKLGVSRTRNGPLKLQINGDSAIGVSELAQTLPVQLINTDTLRILEGSPKDRRTFLDWGVFHVEHHFLHSWRLAKKALNQRNQLLKSQAPYSEIEPWTIEFARRAEEIDKSRDEYTKTLVSGLQEDVPAEIASILDGAHKLTLEYKRGWPEDKDLFTLLMDNINRDSKSGHTSFGPHRADLIFTYKNTHCVEMLSRGQCKLLISCLKIIQVMHLQKIRGINSVLLIDDLPAELDRANQLRLLNLLSKLNCQVFITSITNDLFDELANTGLAAESRLFHVKHGKISTY